MGIPGAELERTLAYARDRHRFGLLSGWLGLLGLLAFAALGGFALCERMARGVALRLTEEPAPLVVGLAFFALLGLGTGLLALPFEAYAVFGIEERHGFNRQTPRGFLADVAKGAALGASLGGLLLAVLIGIITHAGPLWWLPAWAAVTAFSLLTAWVYPTLLAPVFNRFTPLGAGELRARIEALARGVGFRTSGVFVMDASRRSSHGNAYFTGLLGARRIVLFDTLVASLTPVQVVAVLAHELGHFKLGHVRGGLLRGTLLSGALLLVASRLQSLPALYAALGLAPGTPYGLLAVAQLWLSPLLLALRPLLSALSRRDERAADAFAVRQLGGGADLAAALVRLRETSRGLPTAHPWYSRVYHSHPPLVERLKALAAA